MIIIIQICGKEYLWTLYHVLMTWVGSQQTQYRLVTIITNFVTFARSFFFRCSRQLTFSMRCPCALLTCRGGGKVFEDQSLGTGRVIRSEVAETFLGASTWQIRQNIESCVWEVWLVRHSPNIWRNWKILILTLRVIIAINELIREQWGLVLGRWTALIRKQLNIRS